MGFFKKTEKEKEEARIIKEYNEEMDKLEKEYDKENKISIKELFKKDPEEEDLKDYMTPEQLKEEESEKKRRKVFTISAIVLTVGLLVGFGVLTGVYLYVNRGDLDKIHKKEIVDYYKNEYGYNLKVDSIDYMCKSKSDEDCKNKIRLVTTDNQVIYKWDGVYGDNFNNSSVYSDYTEYLKTISPEMTLFWNTPLLTDMDFSETFNMFAESARIMKSKTTFNELVDSNKLVVMDVIMYKDHINVSAIQEFVNKLNDNSKLLFMKSVNAEVLSIDYFEKGYHIELPVDMKVQMGKSITNYRFNPMKVNNPYLNIQLIDGSRLVKVDSNYVFNDAYSIEVTDGDYDYDREVEDEKFDYYLIVIDKTITRGSVFQFDDEEELEVDKYDNFLISTYGGKTYIFANKDISFGTKTKIK